MATQDPPAHLLVTRPYTGPKNDEAEARHIDAENRARDARLRAWYRQEARKQEGS